MSKPPPAASTASRCARRCSRMRASTPCWADACSSRPSACSAPVRSSCAAPTISSASMSEADRKKGVVGWSSGNHAQGLAEAARLMGMKATIVMPADAPALKVANTRASGAEVVLYDRVKDSREEIGLGIAQKTGATVVPPYDHPWILTGQGTAGLEIVEQAKAAGVTLDAVAAPCSGGGLSTGIALAREGPQPDDQRACRRAGGLRRPRALARDRHQAEERQALGLDLRRAAGADAGRRHLPARPSSSWVRASSSPTTKCSTPWRQPSANTSWWSSRAARWRWPRRLPASCR